MHHRRTRARMGVMGVLAVTVAVGVGSAVGAGDGEPRELTSEDGLLTLSIPDGAAPDGVEVAVILRQPAEAPEGIDRARARPFYEISPVDVVFAEPVRVTRLIPLDRFGIDPTAGDPFPIVVTPVHADGEWRWLDRQHVRYDWGVSELIVSGSTMSGGQLLPTSSGTMLLAPDEGLTAAVDGTFRLEAVLRGPPDSALTSTAVGAGTDDLTVLGPRGADDFDFFGSSAHVHDFVCLSAGTSVLDANYEVSDTADTSPVVVLAGLGGADVDVRVGIEVTCTVAPAPSLTPERDPPSATLARRHPRPA